MKHRKNKNFHKIKLIIGFRNMVVHICWCIGVFVLSGFDPKFKVILNAFKMVFGIALK
jgi:uncharacterized protein YutE (UPF0331/DUF86 family)